MSDKSRSPIGPLGILLGFLIGSSYMMFLGNKKGKDLRKELLKKWEDGEGLLSTKMKIVLREIAEAFTELKPALEEFRESPKAKKVIEKGKEKVKEVKEDAKRQVSKGKKKAAQILREVSGFKKEPVKKVVKKKKR